jgi:predicted metal-dependent peptidase
MKDKIKKIVLKEKEAYLYDWINQTVVKKIKHSTMGVNQKKELFVNEKFIQKLSDKELVGCLYHEALHLAYNHVNSRKKNHYLVNIAGDIFINEKLTSLNYVLPDGVLFKKTFNVPNCYQTAEGIYLYLEKNLSVEKKLELKKLNDSEINEIEKIEGENTKNEELNDLFEKIKEEFEEKINNNKKIKEEEPIKWDIDLTAEIGKLIKREEIKNYRRPARYEPPGIIRPANYLNIRVPQIHIYIDKSGSMENTLGVVISSLLKIKSRLKFYLPKYFSFDTKIKEVDEKNLNSLVCGGGTEFNKIIGGADLHIIITDGKLDFSFVEKRKDIIVYLIKDNEIKRK